MSVFSSFTNIGGSWGISDAFNLWFLVMTQFLLFIPKASSLFGKAAGASELEYISLLAEL